MGDFLEGFSLKDIITGYVDISKAKLNSGLAYQDNYIDQLKGTVSLLSQQNAAQFYAQQQNASSFDSAMVIKLALLAGGVFIVYKMVK